MLPPVMLVGLESPPNQVCVGTKGWFIGLGAQWGLGAEPA